MTPLKLELSGFACFREKTLVSFEDLELFAIAGPTGSGKSTILDAMTYALYGQTPRLGSKGLDGLLSPGAMQMSLQFEFSNASGTYRVTRTLDKKPSGKVEAQTRIEKLESNASWKQLAESEKIRDANAKLEQLVGLDYEGFTRAVLLPQGAFDEFLRGDLAKRRSLLVSLLNLDKVQQMQQEAGQRAKQAEMMAKSLEERLNQDYAAATPERRRELTDLLEQLSSERDAHSHRHDELMKQVKELEELKTLFDERAKVQKLLEEVRAREASIKQDRETLERARKVELLLPQVKQLEILTTRSEQLLASSSTKEKQRETVQRTLADAKAVFEKLESQTSSRLPEIDEQLASLSALLPLGEQLRSRGGSLAIASEADDSLPYSEEAWETLQGQLAQLPVLKQSERTVAEVEKDGAELAKNVEELQQTKTRLEEELTALVDLGKKARASLKEIETAYQRATLSDQAALLREHLHVGDSCPVCQQYVSVLPPKKQSEAIALEKQRDELAQRVEALLSKHSDVKAKLTATTERITERERERERLRKKWLESKETLEKSLTLFSAFGSQSKEIETSLQARRRLLLASLAQHISVQTGGVDVTQTQRALQSEKRELTEKLKSSEATLRQAEREADKLETELSSLHKQLEETTRELAERQQDMQLALSKARFASIAEVKSAGLSEVQMKLLETELSNYESQKANAERRDMELQSKLSGRTFDEEQFLSVQEEQNEVVTKLSEVQKQFGATERDLRALEEMLEKAKDLRKQKDEQQKRFDTYRQLSLDLRGNVFQDYLLNQMQGKLAARASHIIREVTEKRYDLRLVEGDYQVFDAWSGELRSAKTLSGGETFIASLALALALSDTIAGSKALGALFLDEGFGTLDADTLESVAEVLENLSSEGRMVGLITHVQALAERLPARLIVSKSAEGSRVSWDM